MGGGQGGRKRIASHGVHRVSRRRHKTGELRRWPWNVLSNLPYSTCVRAVDMCVICERFKRKPCAGTIVCLPIWSSSRCVSASSQHTYVCTPPAEPGGASGGLFARMHKPQTHVQGTMFVGAVPWLSAGLHDAGGFRAHCSLGTAQTNICSGGSRAPFSHASDLGLAVHIPHASAEQSRVSRH